MHLNLHPNLSHIHDLALHSPSKLRLNIKLTNVEAIPLQGNSRTEKSGGGLPQNQTKTDMKTNRRYPTSLLRKAVTHINQIYL